MNALTALFVWFAATFGGYAPVECVQIAETSEVCPAYRSGEPAAEDDAPMRRDPREHTHARGTTISNGF